MNRTSRPNPTLANVIVIVLACLIMVFLWGRIEPDSPRFAGWDLHLYRRMADAAPNLNLEIRPPFVYRILGPYLAGILPVQRDSAFLFLTLGAAFLVPLTLYMFLRKLGVTPSNATLSTVLFIASRGPYGFAVWDYYQFNDLLALLWILLLLWTAHTGSWLFFGLILVLGVLTREVIVLMPIVVLVYLIESGRWSKERSVFLLSLAPAAFAFLSLVLMVLAHGTSPTYYAGAVSAYGRGILEVQPWLKVLVFAFAPVSLFPLLTPGKTWRLLMGARHLLLLYAVTVGTILFSPDMERLMAPAFVSFYFVLGKLLDENPLGSRQVAVLLIAAFLGSLHHIYARYPLPTRETTVLFSGAATALATGVYWWRLRIAAGSPPHPVSLDTR
ncbi:MAG: hypothetical protein RDU83_09945 [bacterium]|nr:hypothetical protein [bacterium]